MKRAEQQSCTSRAWSLACLAKEDRPGIRCVGACSLREVCTVTFKSVFVPLTRMYRGDLQIALELYRKAESYVPDNPKLKERWIRFVIHVFMYKLTLPSL
jgi:hypothetical protein